MAGSSSRRFLEVMVLKKLILSFFDKKFLKFCLVGAANTLVGSGLMFVLYNLCNCSYNFSTVMNYVVGSILSYFLNRYFTFEVKERAAHQGINPSTKEPMQIPASKSPVFKSGKQLKDAVNK